MLTYFITCIFIRLVKILRENLSSSFLTKSDAKQGPVVQNFISLTLMLCPQFVNYISTSKANTLLFLLKKM